MGRLWDIIDAHMATQAYRPSLRQVAARLDVAPTTLSNWRNPRALPEPEHLHAVAELTGVAYTRVLDAALLDAGYLPG